jgi:hypothetical protein
VSFGFVSKVYDPCTGYWNKELNWYEGKTIKEEWIIDILLNKNYNEQ